MSNSSRPSSSPLEMAAPSIPNLNSLRGRTGLRRGRGRRLPFDPDAPEEDPQHARDKIIRSTDGDASNSRLSAVALGYLQDDYATCFLQGQIPRRYPLINRGTYVRTTAIDRLVDQFLATTIDAQGTHDSAAPVAQIISLGAGSDTRFFRLSPARRQALLYHELDFIDNVQAKLSAIESYPDLKQMIPGMNISPDKNSLLSPNYNLHAIDLRQFADSNPPAIPNLRSDLPTLLLSECCLCYVPPTTATQILSYFTDAIPTASLAIIIYEPIRPYDSFGKTMITNLASRGIELQTVKRYYSLAAQRNRFNKAGFTSGQGARDVEQIYYGEEWVSAVERDRVERLEWLDEVEEWKLLASHYCVAWAWRDPSDAAVFGHAWKHVDGAYTDKEAADDDIM
ncbi:leucine carboxyl methyltransferase [Aureobasidium pullulans]|uniref:Leucine carboxyl methyltransferase 1 n=1 Tax=Aureobasidium pullulans TaxID=5580 RepID=A0A4V4J9D1_AURPU|nr:leucine carboxyl methyltransferase [Aureobasidium pullulans]THX42938.1 leucine carboxyl methyltransferase [Aureobasidium pullulans]TIA30404.1 leucine carboxyl methyltransferase [Aureobasidium pullulans]